ncbi:MAG TPA: M23 family metallopeptidase [Caulobacteraceae bacterium]|jgi:murein DD-endopeptidase MepM/ murein hydrolase activator NlpD|nr:M23 family metallopeptidase [Caulobacteraceae bacterium]
MVSLWLASRSARGFAAIAQTAAALTASLALGADAGATSRHDTPTSLVERAILEGLEPAGGGPFAADASLHLRLSVDDRPYPLFAPGGPPAAPVAVGDLLRCLFEPRMAQFENYLLNLSPAPSPREGEYFGDCPASDFTLGDRMGGPLLLSAPVGAVRISSGFGMRLHPILGFTRMHEGVDFAASLGAPVLAAGDGVVEEARWAGEYGRWLKIRHGSKFETGYAHLSAWAPGIAPGVEVRRGEVVAFVGASGLATGPHLHFEVIRGGRRIDPQSLERKGGSAGARFVT